MGAAQRLRKRRAAPVAQELPKAGAAGKTGSGLLRGAFKNGNKCY